VSIAVVNWEESDGVINDARKSNLNSFGQDLTHKISFLGYNWWKNGTGPSVCCNPRGSGLEIHAHDLQTTSFADWCTVPDCTLKTTLKFDDYCALQGACPSAVIVPSWVKVVVFVFGGVFDLGALILVALRYRGIRLADKAAADRKFEAQIAESMNESKDVDSSIDLDKMAMDVMRDSHNSEAYASLLSFATKFLIVCYHYLLFVAVLCVCVLLSGFV